MGALPQEILLTAAIARKEVERALALIPKPRDGRDPDYKRIFAEVRRQIEELPKPKDGASPSDAQIESAVRGYFAKNPIRQPQDGRGPTNAEIATAVSAWLTAHPPKDGEDGNDGPSIAQVSEMVRAEMSKIKPPPVQPGKPGRDAPLLNLEIGEVHTLPPWEAARATITGKSPNQKLNLWIPAGRNGASGGTATSQKASTVKTITESYSIESVDQSLYCDNTDDITVTLPDPSNNVGRAIRIKRINTGNVTLSPASGQIEKLSSLDLDTDLDAVHLEATSSAWWIVS